MVETSPKTTITAKLVAKNRKIRCIKILTARDGKLLGVILVPNS
jgi:hypothetical protein